MSDRKSLLRDGTELLARLAVVTRESSQLTTRVRVDRLLESACPAIGVRYWNELKDTYWADVREDRYRADEVYDHLFEKLKMEVPCGCTEFIDTDGIEHQACDPYDLPGTNLPFQVWWRETMNNRDVIDDPELGEWVPPRREVMTCTCDDCVLAERQVTASFINSDAWITVDGVPIGTVTTWVITADVDDEPLHLLEAEVDSEP